MTDKTLLGIGIAAVATPVAAFLLFGGLDGKVAKPSPPAAPLAAPRAISTTARAAATLTISPQAASKKAAVASRVVNAQVLEDFARSVQLSENENPQIGNKRDLWAKALPAAEELANNSNADCLQHNWLVQFVNCGQRALDNSPDYYIYANSLATTPRDNRELSTGVPSP